MRGLDLGAGDRITKCRDHDAGSGNQVVNAKHLANGLRKGRGGWAMHLLVLHSCRSIARDFPDFFHCQAGAKRRPFRNNVRRD